MVTIGDQVGESKISGNCMVSPREWKGWISDYPSSPPFFILIFKYANTYLGTSKIREKDAAISLGCVDRYIKPLFSQLPKPLKITAEKMELGFFSLYLWENIGL